MFGKVLFTVTLLGVLGQSWGYSLTKEIQFESKVIPIGQTAVHQVFPKFEETVESLDNLYKTTANPEVADVLAIFNKNFDSDMFVLRGDYIEVDPFAYQQFISSKARYLVKSVFPSDPLKQIVTFGALQVPIQKALSGLTGDIQIYKIPIEKISSLSRVGTRSSIQSKTIIDDVYNLVESAICSAVEEFVSVQVSGIISNITSSLNAFDSALAGGTIDNIISGLIDEVITVLGYIGEAANNLTSEACTSIISGRKRRDLVAINLEESVDVVESDTRLVKRDVALDNILAGVFDIVYSFIIDLVNSTLKSLASSLITDIETVINSFLEDTVLAAINSLIDSIVTV